MTSSDYWPHFAMDARTALTPAQIGELAALDLRVWRHMNASMIALVSELREAGLRTAILSNMQPELLRILRADAAWLDAFDVHVFSCDLQMVKPEPEIRRRLLAALDALPGEVIFIDDLRVNVEGARALGIHALQYTSLPELRSQLSDLLAQAASVPSSSRAAAATVRLSTPKTSMACADSGSTPK